MQKVSLVAEDGAPEAPSESDRYTAEDIATLAVSSEEEGWSVENLFTPGSQRGWHAGSPGRQTIRLTFERPAIVRQLDLVFLKAAAERTQEFTLSYIGSHDGVRHEIVRQQWNFSPLGSTEERETFHMQLSDVAVLELNILPNIAGGDAFASLHRFIISR